MKDEERNKIVCVYNEVCFLYNDIVSNNEKRKDIKIRLYKIIKMIEELDEDCFNND